MAEHMTRSAYPGVFAGGKQIVRTEEHTEVHPPGIVHFFTFWFDDGSRMRIVGQFDFRYLPAPPNEPITYENDVIEGTAKELPAANDDT
jgi:hypothetical protein